MRSGGHFERTGLPEPVDYFEKSGVPLIGRGSWRSALCPFHNDHSPSLRVNTETGAFRCMACGAKGGDVLAFHRKRYGLSFVQAARDLGAWESAR
jgi:DNA primase